MADLEIINKMNKVEKVCPNKTSFEEIICQVPMLTYEDAMLYELYLSFNKDCIGDEERNKLKNIIETLKFNRMIDIKKNVDFLTRHERE